MTKQKPRLQVKYKENVAPQLAKEFDIKNPLAIPKIEKIVINSGIGQIIKNKEAIKALKSEIAAITGQVPAVRAAKISVASFGIRAGMPVGLKVTLRGEKMYAFLDKLISVVLPRLRDFRGLSLKGFDKSGNYTLGLSEHSVFPEIDLGKGVNPHGLEITIVTKAKDLKTSRRLLELAGMPFEKTDKN